MTRRSARSLPRQARGPRPMPRVPRGIPLRPPRSRTGRTVLAVVGSLGVVIGLATVTSPEVAAGHSPGSRVVVRSTVAVCPHPKTIDPKVTQVAIAAPPAPDRTSGAAAETAEAADAGEGKATVGAPGSKKKPLLSMPEPGTMAYLDAPALGDETTPLLAKATGDVAPGFAASQITRDPSNGGSRSLAGTHCPEAGTEFWFAGTGTGADRFPWLYITNPESASARVDIELYGDRGRIDVAGFDALVLPAGESFKSLLPAVAPEHDRMVVRVIARVGRVVAALHDQTASTKPLGADWIPGARRASTTVVVPGVPGGSGGRTLYLFVPGEEGALARLRLVGKNGTFSPASAEAGAEALDTIPLEASRIKEIDLSVVARGEPFAVLIDSDKPIIATMRVDTGVAPPDTAYLTGTPPLGGPSLVSDVRTVGNQRSKLVLSAPGKSAKVLVTALVKGKEPREVRTAEIPAGRTVEVSLAKVKGVYAILLTPLPGSGPVYASRVLTENFRIAGDLLTIEQFQPSHTTALVPDVVNDLSAGLRPGE